ncbi:MAG: cation diffusion facilitator family transporter [Actinomycetota bacterium]|nr:cation diffusion facilitator family transporter [Actinomycetota bacterium]
MPSAHTRAHPHLHARASAGTTSSADRRLLALALAVLLAFMALEVVVGLVAGSLALLADAGHMLTDALALAFALVAAWAASRPARGRWTFGFGRAEILAAQANGIALALIAVWIVYAAIRRLLDPIDVDAALVAPVALAGIVVNLAVLALLARAERQSLNVRGAYLHVATDLAAFVGTALAAGLILLTEWDRFDPIASLFVAGLALAGAWTLLRESGQIFLEGAPSSAPPDEVGDAIVEHPGVVEAHDLHVWTVTSGFPALSAHVLVEPAADCHRIRLELERVLEERFGIAHTTLQVDHVGVESGLEISRRI